MFPRLMRSNHRSLPFAWALGLLAAAAPLAAAQTPTWVPLTPGAAPGQPAEIVFDDGASTASDSFFDVFVHGFWSETLTPGDGFTYERIEVPGLSRHGQSGAPDLPRAVLPVATSTSAPAVLVTATDLAPHVFPGLLPYPREVPQLDGGAVEDEDGTPAVFVVDAAIYGGAAAWPAELTPPTSPVGRRFGTIPSAEVAVSLGRWDPQADQLVLSAHTRVHVQAPGGPVVFPPMTKERAALASQAFPNWPTQVQSFPFDPDHFQGRYLIVVSQDAESAVQAFIEHKTLQGFSVEVLLLESLAFLSCGNLRAAIADWYEAGDPNADHYCLLVGDVETLPQCSSLSINPKLGDDLYGSPVDGDLDEEIFVGRITYDPGYEHHVSYQLSKVMAYELDSFGQDYDEVLLVANAENAPGKYEGNCDEVAAFNYAVPPNFTKIFGSQPASMNSAVVTSMEAGKGLVVYRGHGGSQSWSAWNLSAQSFNNQDAASATLFDKNPVVWSFSCWNNRLDKSQGTEDSIGETWMENYKSGAVAHYGSTDVSGTKQNHRLNLYMHQAVFGKGILRHGQAIAWAEPKMAADEPGLNSWMYMLLGDPSMRVRRSDATPAVVGLPGSVQTNGAGTGGQPWVVEVTDALGAAQAGVLVTAWQPAADSAGPALFANGYTDGEGRVAFDLPATGLHTVVKVGIADDEGNFQVVTIPTSDGTWTNVGGGLDGESGAPVLTGQGQLAAGQAVSLHLSGARPDAPGALVGSVGSVPVPFKGGALLAFPWALMLDLGTDGAGQAQVGTVWPAGVPAGMELMFQQALVDPAAAHGVALSNGLGGLTS